MRNQKCPLLIRWNTGMMLSTGILCLLVPLLAGERKTPVVVSLGGETYHPLPLFVALYLAQCTHVCYCAVMCGFDGFFMQCIQQLSYKYRTMSDLLKMLRNCQDMAVETQTGTLGLIYRMHVGTLK